MVPPSVGGNERNALVALSVLEFWNNDPHPNFHPVWINHWVRIKDLAKQVDVVKIIASE
jgi:hypothetical protein